LQGRQDARELAHKSQREAAPSPPTRATSASRKPKSPPPASRHIPPRRRPSWQPGTRAATRKATAWPPSSPLRWARVGAIARVRRRGSPVRAVLRGGGRCTLRIRRRHSRIWGCAEEELHLVVGWRPEPGGGDSGWCGGGATVAVAGAVAVPSIVDVAGLVPPRWWGGALHRRWPRVLRLCSSMGTFDDGVGCLRRLTSLLHGW
jgi:hypothetical protein